MQDAKTIARHRRSMFRDMSYDDDVALDSMTEKFLPWIKAKLESGDYLGWLAVTESDFVVAGAGLWLMDWPAHMVGSSTPRGNILNVYTEPPFRRRGPAGWLIEAAPYWRKVNEIGLVILHASAEGRRHYESLGFQASNEMQIKL